MVIADTLGSRVIAWARTQPAIGAVVLIGSQARAASGGLHPADAESDWDFHLITREPGIFRERGWVREAGISEPLAYVNRLGRLASAQKISVVLAEGSLDLVIVPERSLALARLLWRLGLAGHLRPARRGLSDMATVLRGGYQVLKDRGGWEKFCRRLVTEFPPHRLDDSAICSLAEGFVCDYVSVRAKLARGELLAAQRWLHHQLAETNFQLLHELRQRRGEPSYPDARRIELTNDGRSRDAVTIAAAPELTSLAAAAEKSAATLRGLMRDLVGERWSWPAELK